MKHCLTATIIVVVCASAINGQEICPTGKPSIQSCNRANPCPSGSICYRNNISNFCCGDLDEFCPTKMHAFNTLETDSYLWGLKNNTDAKWYKDWYDVTMGNETIACPIPYSFTYSGYKDIKKVLPVDFDATKPESSKPKACKVNSDCDAGNEEFCGPVSHPTDEHGMDRSGKDKESLRFCYKFYNFGQPNLIPVLIANGKDLTGCNRDSECHRYEGVEAFCLIANGTNVLRIADGSGNVKINKGFCAKVHACDLEKHTSSLATMSRDNEFCKTNADCEGSAGAIKYPGWAPKCVGDPYLPEVRMCCIALCGVGTVTVPLRTCSKHRNCNTAGKESAMNLWCDEKSKHCCQDTEKKYFCPDGATPYLNEPKCNGSSSSDIESGTCPLDGGICRHGHCCPSLVVESPTEYSVGKKSYITNLPCEPTEGVPLYFKRAFCDPIKKHIVIMGTETVNGNTLGKKGIECKCNTDCKRNEVCANGMRSGDLYCFTNPLHILEKYEYESPFKVNETLIQIAAFLFVFACLQCVLCVTHHYWDINYFGISDVGEQERIREATKGWFYCDGELICEDFVEHGITPPPKWAKEYIEKRPTIKYE